MLPAKKPEPSFRTLEELRQRKEQLYEDIQHDNQQFSTLWNQIFVRRKDVSKGEFVTSLITNSVTAVDAFLLVRKLLKNYRSLFGRRK
jgi:hypothetical protein